MSFASPTLFAFWVLFSVSSKGAGPEDQFRLEDLRLSDVSPCARWIALHGVPEKSLPEYSRLMSTARVKSEGTWDWGIKKYGTPVLRAFPGPDIVYNRKRDAFLMLTRDEGLGHDWDLQVWQRRSNKTVPGPRVSTCTDIHRSPSFQWSDSGNYLAIDPTVLPIFLVEMGDEPKTLWELPEKHNDFATRSGPFDALAGVTAFAFSPDDEFLALGSYDGELLIAEVKTGQVLARQRLGDKTIRKLRFDLQASPAFGHWLVVLHGNQLFQVSVKRNLDRGSGSLVVSRSEKEYINFEVSEHFPGPVTLDSGFRLDLPGIGAFALKDVRTRPGDPTEPHQRPVTEQDLAFFQTNIEAIMTDPNWAQTDFLTTADEKGLLPSNGMTLGPVDGFDPSETDIGIGVLNGQRYVFGMDSKSLQTFIFDPSNFSIFYDGPPAPLMMDVFGHPAMLEFFLKNNR